jgi:hypothetical protein
MSARRPNALLGIAVILVIMAGALPEFGPTVCVDGCDDCAGCGACAPARVPVIVTQPEGRLTEPIATHETLDPVRPSRSEERDVFHVPRPIA